MQRKKYRNTIEVYRVDGFIYIIVKRTKQSHKTTPNTTSEYPTRYTKFCQLQRKYEFIKDILLKKGLFLI